MVILNFEFRIAEWETGEWRIGGGIEVAKFRKYEVA